MGLAYLRLSQLECERLTKPIVVIKQEIDHGQQMRRGEFREQHQWNSANENNFAEFRLMEPNTFVQEEIGTF